MKTSGRTVRKAVFCGHALADANRLPNLHEPAAHQLAEDAPPDPVDRRGDEAELRISRQPHRVVREIEMRALLSPDLHDQLLGRLVGERIDGFGQRMGGQRVREALHLEIEDRVGLD
jgi:hypothetical protein